MRYLFILLLLTGIGFQTTAQQLDYFPEQREGVTDQKYKKAVNTLKRTYEAVKNDPKGFTYADHVNLLTAYMVLKEPKEKALEQLELAQLKDLESTAQIFLYIYSQESFEGYLTAAEYDQLHSRFSKIVSEKKEEKKDLRTYAKEGGYNLPLIRLLDQLHQQDKQYRSYGNVDMNQQVILDAENITVIDSLYQKYGTYIGKSLAGEEFRHVMFFVIQHSDLEHQEKYLPVVKDAVHEKELEATLLEMLIDRVYTKKYGYQIFGSQSHDNLASEKEKEEVLRQYFPAAVFN